MDEGTEAEGSKIERRGAEAVTEASDEFLRTSSSEWFDSKEGRIASGIILGGSLAIITAASILITPETALAMQGAFNSMIDSDVKKDIMRYALPGLLMASGIAGLIIMKEMEKK